MGSSSHFSVAPAWQRSRTSIQRSAISGMISKMIPAHDILKLEAAVLEPAPAGKYAVHIAVEHHNAGGGVVNEKPQFDIGFGQFLGIHLEGVFSELALPVGLTICVADRGRQLATMSLAARSPPRRRASTDGGAVDDCPSRAPGGLRRRSWAYGSLMVVRVMV